MSVMSPALVGGFFTTSSTWEALVSCIAQVNILCFLKWFKNTNELIMKVNLISEFVYFRDDNYKCGLA